MKNQVKLAACEPDVARKQGGIGQFTQRGRTNFTLTVRGRVSIDQIRPGREAAWCKTKADLDVVLGGGHGVCRDPEVEVESTWVEVTDGTTVKQQ